MKRSIEERLIKWKGAGRRKPLIVRGGRQVGKTWSIETFGQNHFQSTLKVDLEKRTDLHAIFQRYPRCPEGLILYSGPYAQRVEQKLRFLPLYYAGALADLKD